jgi:hypothetical protein
MTISSSECSSPKLERTNSKLRVSGKIKSPLPETNLRKIVAPRSVSAHCFLHELGSGLARINFLAQHLTQARGIAVDAHTSKFGERASRSISERAVTSTSMMPLSVNRRAIDLADVWSIEG